MFLTEKIKLFISNIRCRLQPGARTSRTRTPDGNEYSKYTILPSQKHGAYYHEMVYCSHYW